MIDCALFRDKFMVYMFKFCFHGIHHGRILYGNELLGNVLRSSYYVGFCVLLVLTEMGNARASEAWSEYEAVSPAFFFYITNLLGGGRELSSALKFVPWQMLGERFTSS